MIDSLMKIISREHLLFVAPAANATTLKRILEPSRKGFVDMVIAYEARIELNCFTQEGGQVLDEIIRQSTAAQPSASRRRSMWMPRGSASRDQSSEPGFCLKHQGGRSFLRNGRRRVIRSRSREQTTCNRVRDRGVGIPESPLLVRRGFRNSIPGPLPQPTSG
jgi:hypothetical protein